jgi:hypothetical protein
MDTNKVKNLAKDLTKDSRAAHRRYWPDMLLLLGSSINAAQRLLELPVSTISIVRLDNFFFSFAEISGDQFKDFVATGASEEELAKWIEQKAKQRRRIEIVRWNNEWRYERLSERPDRIQEFMEYCIPEFVPAHLRHHVDYFFDIYTPKRTGYSP